MQEVPIQVKKGLDVHKKASVNARVDLKNGLPKKKTSRLWWVVLVLLLLSNAVTFGYYYLFKPSLQEIPYTQYVAHDQTIVFSVMDKDQLYEKIRPWSAMLGSQFSFLSWLTNQADSYFKQAGLDYEEDISSLFRKKIGFVVYQKPDSPNSFPFIVFLEKKAASAQINSVLEQLNKQFKKDFYQTDELYRQNNVVSLKSIKRSYLTFYYTQIKDYFIISNSKKHLESTIDLVIKEVL